MNSVTVTLSGERPARYDDPLCHELEIAGVDDLPGPIHLKLDFKQVTFISSLELGKLVSLNRKCRDCGGRLSLCNVNGHVREVIHITRLDKLLSIE